MSDDELFEKVKLWIVIKACNSNTFGGDIAIYKNYNMLYTYVRTHQFQPQNDFIIEMRGLKLIVWLKAHHGLQYGRGKKNIPFWTQNSLQFHNAY